MISYGKQYIDKNDINNVTKTLKSSYLTQGPNVIKFENKYLPNNFLILAKKGLNNSILCKTINLSTCLFTMKAFTSKHYLIITSKSKIFISIYK